jgi:hypothetical protein
MSAKAGVAAAGAETSPDAPPRTPSSKARQGSEPPAPEEALGADLRLVIDEAGEPAQHLYTVLDRRTGKIVHQFRRGEMLRRVEQGRYLAGDGVSVKA